MEFDDLRQFGMVAAIEAIPKFDPTRGASLKTYVSQRVKFAMRDFMRAMSPKGYQRQRMRVNGAPSVIAMSQFPDLQAANANREKDYDSWYGRDPADKREENAAMVDRRDQIKFLLWSLEPQSRQCVFLYHLRQMTMRDVGHVLGISESRVSQVMTQAMAHLRELAKQTKELGR